MRNVHLLRAILAGTMALLAWSPPEGQIHGHVYDLFGDPLAGAAVEVLPENSTSPARVVTDRAGSYRISGLPSGRLSVSVHLLGFEEEKKVAFSGTSEQQGLDFGLRVGNAQDGPPTEVEGFVRALDGAPLSGSTVSVSSAFNERLNLHATTDREGHYKVDAYYPGQYLAYASKPGFKVSATVLVIAPKAPREHFTMDLTLTPLAK